MNIEWRCRFFDKLTPSELYDIIQLRNDVFVVEQQCVFQDADGVDKKCFHLSGYDGDTLVAYTRLIAPGITFTEASIGRVVNARAYRGMGIGKELMRRSLQYCRELFGVGPVMIGAQLYLKKFYEELGFNIVGEVYLEDNIPHIHMDLILQDKSRDI
jgi:ElaA protein